MKNLKGHTIPQLLERLKSFLLPTVANKEGGKWAYIVHFPELKSAGFLEKYQVIFFKINMNMAFDSTISL